MKIVTSVVGTGPHAKAWAETVNKNDNFILKNVLSRTESRGLEFAKSYNCQFVFDPKKILEDEEIKLIIISSNPERNILAIDFAKKGKNMILEKPLSFNYNDAELIYSQCKKNDIICGAGLKRYHDNFFPIVKKYIKTLGKCFYAEYNMIHKNKKTDKKFSLEHAKQYGSIFLNHVIHKFVQVNKLFGKPKSLIANKLSSADNGIVISSNILVKYEEKIMVCINLKNDCENEFGELMNLYCEKGIIEINFNTQTVSAIQNPFNNRFSRPVLSKFKKDLLNRKIFKFKRKKIFFSDIFYTGTLKDILENFAITFFGNKDADLVNIDHHYLSTKMALACEKSIKNNVWVDI